MVVPLQPGELYQQECNQLTGLPKLDRLKGSGKTNISHISSMLKGNRRITQTENPRAGDALKP
ncbi:hypothetical protein DPMN_000082 [Dreissena polymorpha]|uniref:Uncharacterized protein n=1 Tax=Dreissena polymorpha TaxID=45954 RepID=A0A9D4MF61_DREPO|nr:hypothetical protein DPMN_000082 [Dreissena polymorpha]